jgi:predicted RNA-binding Zn ribbon-like protein
MEVEPDLAIDMANTNTHSSEKSPRRRAPRFELISGDAFGLDFINTRDDRFSDESKELLNDYVDLARFAEDAGALSPSHVDRLIERSPLAPEDARTSLAAAIHLRETMYAVFSAIMAKKPVPAGALLTLNQYVQTAAGHLQLAPKSKNASGPFEWRFEETPLDFDAPWWPIARSAGELLASDKLPYVRACESKTCQWFFLDTSKNHRRRWCDMTKCGNRAKAQRFYARQREER